MTVQHTDFTPELLAYLRQISAPEHPILSQIRAETAQHRLGHMAIAPEQSALLAWLARLIGVRRYLEIGVFLGYNSTAMALALPDDARLTCCDINVTFTQQAQSYWQQAGVAHKIDLHLQPAIITMDELISSGKSNYYDMALIDADKPPTPQYFERCLKLLRVGGILAIDNILLGGRIIQAACDPQPPSHAILREFNAHLPKDTRVHALTVPVGDGLTLLIKN